MKVELLHVTPAQVCATAAAVCHDSAPSVKLLQKVVDIGHDSIKEFQDFTFLITDVSRALTHQLVRHRIASYAQQSQRHVKTGLGEWFHIPQSILDSDNNAVKYLKHMDVTAKLYAEFIESGIPLEDARYILPNATYSAIVVKMNARELDHFFKLRCCNHAQAEIRRMANTMLKICKNESPTLFAGVSYPDCKNCKEKCGEILC